MVTDAHTPQPDEVTEAMSALLSYWTGHGEAQDDVVARVMADMPDDDHNQRRVLMTRTKERRKSPVETFVDSLEGDWLLVKDVARRLDMSESWVRLMSKDEDVGVPSYTANFGRVKVGLYTEEDVESLASVLTARREIRETA